MEKIFLTLLLLIGFTTFDIANASVTTETLPNANTIEMAQLNQADTTVVVITRVTVYGIYDDEGNCLGTVSVVSQTFIFLE